MNCPTCDRCIWQKYWPADDSGDIGSTSYYEVACPDSFHNAGAKLYALIFDWEETNRDIFTREAAEDLREIFGPV